MATSSYWCAMTTRDAAQEGGDAVGIFSQLRGEGDEPSDASVAMPDDHDPLTTAEEPGVPDGRGEGRGRITRRGFLGGTAAAGAAAAAAGYYFTGGPHFLRHAGLLQRHGGPAGHAELTGTQSSTPAIDAGYDLMIQVERDADLVLLDFYFYNFTVGTNGFGTTSLIPTAPDNHVIVRFPPQAIAEGVYWEVANPATQEFCDPSPILSAMSGQSQLSFQFGTTDWIALPNMTPDDLLNWSGWPLQVALPAQVPQTPVYNPWNGHSYYPYPVAPGPFDTFVEFPYCMFLAPSVFVPPTPGFTNGGFYTEVSNVVAPVTSAAGVVDVFTSAVIQGPYEPGETGMQTGLVALWSNDLTGPWGTPGTNIDATPEAAIFYGTQIA
jgi:hypothetical protein